MTPAIAIQQRIVKAMLRRRTHCTSASVLTILSRTLPSTRGTNIAHCPSPGSLQAPRQGLQASYTGRLEDRPFSILHVSSGVVACQYVPICPHFAERLSGIRGERRCEWRCEWTRILVTTFCDASSHVCVGQLGLRRLGLVEEDSGRGRVDQWDDGHRVRRRRLYLLGELRGVRLAPCAPNIHDDDLQQTGKRGGQQRAPHVE